MFFVEYLALLILLITNVSIKFFSGESWVCLSSKFNWLLMFFELRKFCLYPSFFMILSNNKKDQNLEKLCLHCSSREEIATKAERASIKFMQVKFMSKNINKSYEGVISGIMERGIFVEATENKCEGFIRIKDIPGDYFSFLENEMLILGRHTKEEYRLGDKVLIKVLAVNQSKKQIDFSLIEKM